MTCCLIKFSITILNYQKQIPISCKISTYLNELLEILKRRKVTVIWGKISFFQIHFKRRYFQTVACWSGWRFSECIIIYNSSLNFELVLIWVTSSISRFSHFCHVLVTVDSRENIFFCNSTYLRKTTRTSPSKTFHFPMWHFL